MENLKKTCEHKKMREEKKKDLLEKGGIMI